MKLQPYLKIWAALLGGLFLASCERTDTGARTAPDYVDGAQCLFELAANDVEATSWDAPQAGQCSVSAPVSVAAAGASFEPVLRSSCAMVLRWQTFVPVIDRLAQQHLGSPVKTVHHVGSYACRRMRGGSRMSLHAEARALDLYAFDTVSGVRVSVQKDWHPRGPKRDFLRALARASCDHFSVTLTPNHDRAHQDHIHIDIGPWKLCRA